MPPDDLRHDPLTGALTRHHFDAMLSQHLDHAATHDAAFSLLVVDIDHFKSINDSFGHPRGDTVLVDVVRRLRQMLRTDDTLVRFGGDEFVVLLPTAARTQALEVAERLVRIVDQTPFAGSPPIRLSLSIGLATFPGDADTPEGLLQAADRRLYQAKRLGRGRVSIADASSRLVPPVAPTRLIERDQALGAARAFLATHDAALRSLCIRAAPGTGRTRYLAELTRSAVALGYATLSIAGDPALRARRYGALGAAASEWPLPPPADGPEPFAIALGGSVRSRGTSRLLITVDEPSEIDTYSLDFLRELVGTTALSHVLLAYIDGPVWASRLSHDPLRQNTATLEPLLPQGILVWLRQALRWEPPASLIAWVSEYSAGYPSRIQCAIDAVIGSGALAQTSEDWIWDGNLALGIVAGHPNTPAIIRQLDDAAPLVGRDQEIAEVRDLLLSSRIVTIVGPGGVGKSRLALQAAAECHAEFPDGAHFVPLAGVQSTGYLPATVVAALQLPLMMSSNVAAQLAMYLRSRELLLVLDNVEHLPDCAALLADWLRAAPNLRILLTSRARLNLLEERVVLLDGLALPTAAVDLFLQRAKQVDPTFSPHATDTDAIGAICAVLNGLPLGIELAASFVQTYNISTILAEIRRSLSFLTDARDIQLDRHRSLTAVLDSFWELLSIHEQRSLQALAVFRSGFTRTAARAIAQASPFFLDGLASRMVVRRSSSGRYTIHELLRQYADEKLQEHPHEVARSNDRHSAYFLQYVLARYLRHDSDADETTDPQFEIDNVWAAWETAVVRQRIERIGESTRSFFVLLIDLGLLREGVQANETARARIEASCRVAGREDILAHLDAMRGAMLYQMGRYNEAIEAAEQAERLLGDYPAPAVRACCLYTLGTTHLVLGQQLAAQARLEQALTVVAGDERLAVEILVTITHLANLAGNSARASVYGQQAVERARRAGNRNAEYQAMLFLGIGEIFQERHAAARVYLEPIVGASGLARQAMTEILSYANLAQISWEVHEYQRAATEIERAIALARTTDMRYLEGLGLRVRGLVALSTGRLSQAEIAFAEAHAIFRASNAERDIARIQTERALLECWRGAHDAALVAADAALTIAYRQQYRPVIASALIHRGHATRGLGQFTAAAEAYRAAYDLLLALGRRNRAMEALAGLIEVALACGAYAEATAHGQLLWAHLQQGTRALGGMYDPMHVCLAAADGLRAYDPTSAQAAAARARQLADAIIAQLPPERAQEQVANIPSLRRVVG